MSVNYTGHGAFLPYLLNRTTAALNVDFQLYLRQHGLTLLHWRVLAFLSEQDGLGVSALSLKTDSDQATLSRALMVLEKNGCIDRRACEQDQRGVNIYLLKKGRETFQQVLPVAWQLHLRAVQGFSEEELIMFNQFLNRVHTNISIQHQTS